MNDTASSDYTNRLMKLERGLLKRAIGPINPYRLNIQHRCSGRVLDVGCGIGRNLRYLQRSDALGVDHNQSSVKVTRDLGFEAIDTERFRELLPSFHDCFDTILISHVIEHMSFESAVQLINFYLPTLKMGGKVVLICPQEHGYQSDMTHETYFDEALLRELALRTNGIGAIYKSFPLPRKFGRIFIYNEHILEFRK